MKFKSYLTFLIAISLALSFPSAIAMEEEVPNPHPNLFAPFSGISSYVKSAVNSLYDSVRFMPEDSDNEHKEDIPQAPAQNPQQNPQQAIPQQIPAINNIPANPPINIANNQQNQPNANNQPAPINNPNQEPRNPQVNPPIQVAPPVHIEQPGQAPQQPAPQNQQQQDQQQPPNINQNQQVPPQQPDAPSKCGWFAPVAAIFSPTVIVGGAIVAWIIYLKFNKSVLEKTEEALIKFEIALWDICRALKKQKPVFSLKIIELFHYYQKNMKKLDDDMHQELAHRVDVFAQSVGQLHGKSLEQIAELITPSFKELVDYIEHTCLKDIRAQIANQKIGKSKVWIRIKDWYNRLSAKVEQIFNAEE